jgi:beta-lactamase regulating signal transducer with metallopeptidase domain
MIASWMLYCALCSLGLCMAAVLAERWLLSAGAQVRHLWSAALLLSLVIPAATYRLAPRQTITIPAAGWSAAIDAGASETATQVRTADSRVSAITIDQSFRKFIPNDTLATNGWMLLSAALSSYLVVGLVALMRMRRQWRPRDVCGVRVLVSERTGPAVINPLSPQIVMPEWALAMDRHQLGLMIRHEQEHRRARDPQLLAAAQLALIVMPWNPALWWGVARLGMAVELDCDARVLRTADPRAYGDLLLEVARPRRRPRFVAAAAFAERAGGLERRIRAISRRRDSVTRGARAGAAIVGLAVVGIAWVAPHPSLPPRLTVIPPAPISTSSLQRLENPKRPTSALVRAETLDVRPPEPTFRGDTVILPFMKAYADDVVVRTPRPAFSQLDSLIYDRLFTGVVMSADQEIAARLLLSSLVELQAQQDRSMVVANVQGAVGRLRATQERDSSLLALLTSDADRDVLAARLTTMQLGGGRRGRSGNTPGLAEAPVGPAGGQRSGSRGRVGGGDPVASVSTVVDDVLFAMLFNGIPLSPEQDTAAKSALRTYRGKIVATIPELGPLQLRLQGTSGVAMNSESRAALLAILSNDADRAVVDSRITVPVQIVNRRSAP